MRKQFTSACLIAASGLLLSTSVHAAGTNIQRGAYIGGKAAYSWFENDYDNLHDHHDWYGGQLGFRFTPHFSVEASYLEGKADLRYPEAGEDKKDKVLNRQPLLSVRYHFADSGVLGFEPYVGLAGGEFWTKQTEGNGGDGLRHRETVVGPELGLQRRFLGRLLLDVGARGPYSIDNDRWEGQVYAGLNFLFSVKDRQEPVEEPVEEYVPEPQPEPEPEVVTREVSESGTVAQFQFDSADISESQLEDLRAAARFLSENPETSVTLEGHTCNMGPEEYNLQLSERRAKAAAEFLESQGISSDRITVVGKGSADPIADNDTREGRERNRRVDAIITGTIEETR